jgi:hypothetical protein
VRTPTGTHFPTGATRNADHPTEFCDGDHQTGMGRTSLMVAVAASDA